MRGFEEEERRGKVPIFPLPTPSRPQSSHVLVLQVLKVGTVMHSTPVQSRRFTD